MTKLTEKDKLVFYAIVRWPHLNDIELSEKIDVKRSTISAIKNKLERNNLYSKIKVPDLEKIGCELLTVRYSKFNPLTTFEAREKYSSLHKFPEVFFKRTTDKQRIALSAAKNFTEVKKYIDYSNRVYGEQGFLTDEGIIHVFFPFKTSRIFRFFDYAPLLREHFNLSIVEEKTMLDTEFTEYEPAELTVKEKILLYALVKYPTLNDNQLAEKASMTRQSVSTIRQKLEEEQMVKTMTIPDMKALDFQLLAFTHMLVNPKVTLNMRKHAIEKIMSQGAHIFQISGNLEAARISVFRDYSDCNRTFDEITDYYKEHDLLLRDPITRIFLNSNIKLGIDGRFAPLVKKVLDVKTEI